MELTLTHALVTIYMTGLIWFVQVVHYPLKAMVGEAQFPAYQEAHKARTGWVVGPPMLLEAGCTLWLVFAPPEPLSRLLPIVGLLLLGLIWFITARFSMRYHGILDKGFDKEAHRRLIQTNWLRTGLWTCRSGLAAVFLASASAT